MTGIAQRKIQVLRKSVGFEKALFQTCAALEYPGLLKRRMCEDTGEDPPEDVILFDDLRPQAQFSGKIEYV
jgi:hypothetical protein